MPAPPVAARRQRRAHIDVARRRRRAEQGGEARPRLADQHGQPVDGRQSTPRAARSNGVSERPVDHVHHHRFEGTRYRSRAPGPSPPPSPRVVALMTAFAPSRRRENPAGRSDLRSQFAPTAAARSADRLRMRTCGAPASRNAAAAPRAAPPAPMMMPVRPRRRTPAPAPRTRPAAPRRRCCRRGCLRRFRRSADWRLRRRPLSPCAASASARASSLNGTVTLNPRIAPPRNPSTKSAKRSAGRERRHRRRRSGPLQPGVMEDRTERVVHRGADYTRDHGPARYGPRHDGRTPSRRRKPSSGSNGRPRMVK